MVFTCNSKVAGEVSAAVDEMIQMIQPDQLMQHLDYYLDYYLDYLVRLSSFTDPR
jgi:hypothetical protein